MTTLELSDPFAGLSPRATFERTLPRLEIREGGTRFYDGKQARDRNPTLCGITLAAWQGQGSAGDLDGDGDVDVEDLRLLAGRPDLIHSFYWHLFQGGHCDAVALLSPRLAVAHFDAVVNHGPGTPHTREWCAQHGVRFKLGANHMLQRAAGVREDGVIGRETLNALQYLVSRHDATTVCRDLLQIRKLRFWEVLRANPAQRGNRGWKPRLNDVAEEIGLLPVWTEPFEVWEMAR